MEGNNLKVIIEDDIFGFTRFQIKSFWLILAPIIFQKKYYEAYMISHHIKKNMNKNCKKKN